MTASTDITKRYPWPANWTTDTILLAEQAGMTHPDILRFLDTVAAQGTHHPVNALINLISHHLLTEA